MAATKRRDFRGISERTRERIKSTAIVNCLMEHIEGKREMKPSQVQAALGLLRKTVPDLATVEHTGEVTMNAEFTQFLRGLNGADGLSAGSAESSDALAEDAGDLRH